MRNPFTGDAPAAFHSLIEAAPYPLFVADPAASFRFVYANPAAAERFGHPAARLLGMTLAECATDFGAEQVDALQREGHVVFTTLARLRGCECIQCEIRMTAVEIGGETYIAGVLHDVTQQSRAEQALQRSEAQLRTLIETLPDLVWLKDPEGVYLTCNQRFERFFGATRDAIVGRTDYDFVDRGLADFFREKDRLAIASDRPSVNEEEITYADDGHREYLETIKTPMYGPQGELIGVLGIARDITRRKELEAALKERFEVYQTAINTPALGFWLVDTQGALLEVNDAYVGQSGYSRDELLRMRIPDVEAVETPEDTAAHIEAIRQVGYGRFETMHRRKDGSLWPVEVIVTFSGIQGGRIFVFLEDITERRRAKEALERANEALEARVALRTAELSIAKEEAERASRAKSEFLSTMSHELRTPLNAVLGYSQLMQMQPDTNPSQRENLGEILKAGRHLLELINQVLDLARIESGRADFVIENVDCRALVETCLGLIAPLAQARHVGILLQPDALPTELFVRADSLRVRQVLLNLMSNAVKYNKEHGEVRIRLEADDAAIRFQVEDTGVGIPRARHAELFQPFNRIEARNSNVEGAGIGLVISRTLVEAMGGRIGFESQVGVGSTFWIELPRAELADAEAGTSPGTARQDIENT
ncbi:PAS domain S-box protein [Thiobacillus sedimenti]|uniref:histidine kinase n=1 Tax=Thiobacillus sedimenti TaxID=3110231 RepID=A0ABZ1CN29_9PROT|nr:PAS domain S-box protein [Thiobacillus sp. SCUT-2]WRS40594.1 PAS domain S-box protein [Thiobacillus sp. SCUT-2]